jgi:RHS repeat-associated protein
VPQAISAGGNTAPQINNLPPTTIAVGSTFYWAADVTDADWDGFSLTLDPAPDGMDFVSGHPGLISWTPTLSQLGSQEFTLTADDGTADTSQTYTVNVVSQAPHNHRPKINSAGPTSAVFGRSRIYQANATDEDRDVLIWTLSNGPDGMAIDPKSGTLAWTPGSDDVGKTVDAVIRVTDSKGAFAEQQLHMQVHATNGAPAIESEPIRVGKEDFEYLYQVKATDPDDDPIAYSLAVNGSTTATHGLAIDGDGLISGTPDAGTWTISVTASDPSPDSQSATQTYVLHVASESENVAPRFISTPTFHAKRGHEYEYNVQAFDYEDQETLAFTLGTGTSSALTTAGMSIDSEDGTLTWNVPSSFTTGSYPVVVEVTDGTNSPVKQLYTLIVENNTAPIFASVPPDDALIEGEEYDFSIVARDTSGDQVVYDLDVEGPSGSAVFDLTIDPETGEITGTAPTVSNDTTYDVTVTATDQYGDSASHSFQLKVQPDQAPIVVLKSNRPAAGWGSTIQLFVAASDDLGVGSLSLSATYASTTVQIPVRTDGVATFTIPTGITQVTFNAIAEDRVQSGTATLVVGAFDPSAYHGPVITFSSENTTDPISTTAVLEASITDTEEAFRYRVDIAPSDSSDATTLLDWTNSTSSTANISQVIDAAGLVNGSYVLRVSAETENYQQTAEYEFTIDGLVKLGNFGISFNDLTIPVAGIPLVISRSYDSAAAASVGDFGHGWTMNLREAKLQVSTPPNGSANAGFGDYAAFQEGTRVWITLPGGKREQFIFTPVEESTLYWTYWHPAFTPANGVTGTLTVPDVYLMEFGDGFVDASSLENYNPASLEFGGTYTLTTKDNLSYDIDAVQGTINAVSDLSGNRLLYSPNGVQAVTAAGTTAASLEFTRGPHGITEITNPEIGSASTLHYGYSSAGDLISFTDRNDVTTTYGYESNPAHYLSSITRSGVTVLQGDYDSTTHRLTGLTDANGHAVVLNPDPSTLSDSATDALGYATTSVYDANGNPIREIHQTVLESGAVEAEFSVVVRKYDENNNLLAQSKPFVTDEDGRFTAWPVGYDETTTAQNIDPDAVPGAWERRATFDGVGNMLSSTDALGHTTRYLYDSRNRLEAVTDPEGNTTSNSYNPSNDNLLSTTDANGNVTTFRYTANGQVSDVFGPPASEGGELPHTHFTYDENGRLLSTTDPSGKEVFFENDEEGRVTVSGFAWDDPATSEHTTVGVNTLTEYDDQGRVTSVTTPEGSVTGTFYNDFGQVDHTTTTIGTDETTTSYKYDAAGNLVETAYPDGTVSRTLYDTLNRASIVMDRYKPESGNPTKSAHGSRTIYDGMGRVVQTDRLSNVLIDVNDGVVEGTFTSNLHTGITPSVLSSTSTVYNDDGTVASSTDSAGETTSYTYDAAGRTESSVQPETTVWDPAANDGDGDFVTDTPVTAYEYDAAGRQIKVTDALGHATQYEYDAAGHVINTIFADGTRVSDGYDAQGNHISHTDQKGLTTSYQYDVAGRLTEVSQPQVADPENDDALTTPVASYTYDTYGNQLTQTDANGHTTSFTHDQFGHQLTRTLPLGQSEEDVYDSETGRLEDHFDFKGNKTHYHYDSLGRVDVITYFPPGSSTVGQTFSYTYDDLGRQQHVVDSISGQSARDTIYSYDLDGRLSSVESPEGTVHYEYDPATGQLVSTWTGGSGTTQSTADDRTDYGYDELGRLDTVTALRLRGSTVGQATSYSYDLAGNRHSTSVANGLVTTYQYDNLNRLTQQETTGPVSGSSALFSQFIYTYDKAGNRVSMVDSTHQNDSPDLLTLNHTYTYDNLNRLTRETLVGAGIRQVDYVYDLVGNRLSQTVLQTGGGDCTIASSFEYDGNDQLTSQQVITTHPDLDENYEPIVVTDSDVTTDYTYDPNGSMTEADPSNASPTRYLYDLRNRLSLFDASGDALSINGTTGSSSLTGTLGSSDVSYGYDDNGDRISRTQNGTTIKYLQDSNSPAGYSEVLEEKSGSGTILISYVYGQDLGPISQNESANGNSYYVTDGLGSTRLLTHDPVSSTVYADGVWFYDAFGNGMGSDNTNLGVHFAFGSTPAHYLFTGQRLDSESGLYNMRARQTYSPIIGRFGQADAAGYGTMNDPLTLHKYVYCGNDPLNRVDPSGHMSLSEGAVLLGLIAFSIDISLVRNTSGLRRSTYAPIPVDEQRLVGMYHSVKIRNSRLSANVLFGSMSRFSERNLYPTQASADVHGVGDIVSFDMVQSHPWGWVREAGQGDFQVRVTKFDAANRYFVVQTLGGHPLAGWRRWQVTPQSNGDILIETYSVEHPATAIDTAKMLGGGNRDMASTWQNMLWGLVVLSNGQMVSDKDTVLAGKTFTHSEALDRLPYVK